eukprot:superscaffoldBa00003384_g16806
MTEMDLLNILDDLIDDEFKKFKWCLKYEKVGDIPPIKEHQLSGAKRRDVVDLMVQNFKFSGAVEVIKSILKKISRNDLVRRLPNIGSGAEGWRTDKTVLHLTDIKEVSVGTTTNSNCNCDMTKYTSKDNWLKLSLWIPVKYVSD